MASHTLSAGAKHLAAAVLLATLPLALAHGDEEHMDMDMAMASPEPQPDSDPANLTYFRLPEHTGAIYGHIVLMVLAWIVVLPIGVMFSIARSRYTVPTQFFFLATNAAGLVLGLFYNANTPDLYPNNAHHKLGWLVFWVACAQVLISMVGRASGALGKGLSKLRSHYKSHEEQAFIPVSTGAIAAHAQLYAHPYQHNNAGANTADSSRSNSVSTMVGQESPTRASFDQSRTFDHHGHDNDGYDDDLEFKPSELRNSATSDKSLLVRAAGLMSRRVWSVLSLVYNFIDRTILILGSITIATGIITYARFFEGHEVFSGLAHWIKGGVFFWYGTLTLGRWCGSFGDLGWAWNVRPETNAKWQPTAEFVEGFLIFFYGSTNIFLEHLGNAGEPFSHQDLEHAAITVLFIGGGLLTMLIESNRIRDLLNTTVEASAASGRQPEQAELERPDHYGFSINPIPALVILLLGIMMSSHTQADMTSSMVHKQWGNLLAAASFARGFTYIIMYMKPPRSLLPGRPPTELLTAFGLIAGGIIFMASSEDTVRGMINYELDAMFMYTVTMGFVGLYMAWVVLVLALKGWAVRKESGSRRPLWTPITSSQV
ncbi:uncharacterized protein B0I36DRAFT_244651 [Microdochium trichocladiopsis]|uniref:Integral membrane protein n=1 Tax=Microdochium trichocladiopsis TaxID=1682393 RepID=A0A9P8Y4V3_9PEZI|nr:uncharacterized protein B0I36DRAFT_244651 [Microdochium trichocladiopsis]KAH7029345.1 hypothetical protein B0I36DRAFT_244651 [Microdochium trichocladiopsis]